MSTAAVIGPVALGATTAAGHGPVGVAPEPDGAFNKVLNDHTAKAIDEGSPDGRDGTDRSTKRHRPTNPSTPSTPVPSLETEELVRAHVSAGSLSPGDHVDAAAIGGSPKVGAHSTDELNDAWHTFERTPDEVSERTDARPLHTPDEVSERTDARPLSSSQAPVVTNIHPNESPAKVSATPNELATTPASLSRNSALGSPDEDLSRATVGPSPEEDASVDVATAINVTTSSSNTAAPSLLSARSSSIRSSLRESYSIPVRGGAQKSEPASAASTDAAVHRVVSVGDSASRAAGEYVSAPTITPMVRSALSVAPNPSAASNAVGSSLDVIDLASTISRVTLGSDGSYTINVAMHPVDLGRVQAVVSLNGVDLHVAITPQTPMGHAALSNAVEALKGELSRSGLNVNVSLRDPESRSGGGDDATRAVPGDVGTSDAEVDASPAHHSLNASQIHLIL